MQKALILTLFLQSSVLAFGASCSAGYKFKTDLTSLLCASTGAAASCNGHCCEKDETTCGGQTTAVVCDFGSYIGSGDTWAAKKTTKKTAKTDCCTAKATCTSASGQFTCPGGQKAKTGATPCAADAASCKDSCCEDNALSCGKMDPPTLTAARTYCSGASNTYPTASAERDAMDDAWKNLLVASATPTQDQYNTACCKTAIPTCGSKMFSCPAGKKHKGTTNKIPAVSNKYDSAAWVADCCEDDTTTCGGRTAPVSAAVAAAITAGTQCTAAACGCGGVANSYLSTSDSWKATKFAVATGCCISKATCKDYKCPVGGKKKTGTTDKTICTDDASKRSCESTCCESDLATCGGNKVATGLACKYGYYDATTTWTKDTTQATKDAWAGRPATAANKDVACCDARAACSGVVVTTTPAATTTPSLAVRRYSENEVVVQESSGSNLVWLGAGAFIGMGVLFAVQTLRSRSSANAME